MGFSLSDAAYGLRVGEEWKLAGWMINRHIPE